MEAWRRLPLHTTLFGSPHALAAVEQLAPVQDVYEALVRFGQSSGAAPVLDPAEVWLLPTGRAT